MECLNIIARFVCAFSKISKEVSGSSVDKFGIFSRFSVRKIGESGSKVNVLVESSE